MHRRDISKGLLASAVGAALFTQSRQAQAACTPSPCVNQADQIPVALMQATAGTRVVVQPGDYDIGTTPLVIPNGVTLDITGANIVCSGPTAITFGNAASLSAQGASITTSGAAGASLKKTNPADPGPCYIYGWPAVRASTPGVVNSVGLDFTGAYKGVFEVSIDGFETQMVGGAGSPTPQTYYNEIRSPRIRCTGANSGVGIKLNQGCNGTTIVNPQISGATLGHVGIWAQGCGGLTIVGGYIEGLEDHPNSCGLLLQDTANVTVVGTVLDVVASQTSNHAIRAIGATTQVNLYGLGFAGGWGSSDKIMSWTASGVFNFIGGAPTHQLCLVGATAFIGNELNGTHYGETLALADGIPAPAPVNGRAVLFVDATDGHLKVRFPSGRIKTIATDA